MFRLTLSAILITYCLSFSAQAATIHLGDIPVPGKASFVEQGPFTVDDGVVDDLLRFDIDFSSREAFKAFVAELKLFKVSNNVKWPNPFTIALDPPDFDGPDPIRIFEQGKETDDGYIAKVRWAAVDLLSSGDYSIRLSSETVPISEVSKIEGSVTLEAVPLPPSVLFLGIATLGLAWVGRAKASG